MTIRLVMCNPKAAWRTVEEHEALTSVRLEHNPLDDLNRVAIIVDSTGLPNWPATEYLVESALYGRSATGETARTYGESLIFWLLYLQEREIPCTEASEKHLKLYRNALSMPASQLAPATVRARVLTAIRFHDWGQRTGKLTSPLGGWAQQSDEAMHGRSRRWSSLLPQQSARLPRVATQAQLSDIFRLSHQPYRLMFRWAVCTGLRRAELCNLKNSDIVNASLLPSGLRQMEILRKGGRTVSVYVPQKLIDETYWYALLERPTITDDLQDLIFRTAKGRKVDKAKLSKEFRRVADLAGTNEIGRASCRERVL